MNKEEVNMSYFVASFIGGAIACSISVLFSSYYFYNLGRKHERGIKNESN